MRILASLLVLLALAVLCLPGCNAIKGAAKDVHDMANHTQTFIEGDGSSTASVQ